MYMLNIHIYIYIYIFTNFRMFYLLFMYVDEYTYIHLLLKEDRHELHSLNKPE